MILEMKVPSPGESITEVEIAQWLVAEGDYIEKDQAIAEVDSDKATLELPAETSGTISLKAEEGDAVAVGSVVCLIDTDGKPMEGQSKVSKKQSVLFFVTFILVTSSLFNLPICSEIDNVFDCKFTILTLSLFTTIFLLKVVSSKLIRLVFGSVNFSISIFFALEFKLAFLLLIFSF